MTQPTEIVLFHVHDPAPAVHFGDVPNETLFDVCVRSIRARSTGSAITLLTDEKTDIGDRYEDVTVIRDGALRTEFIMYERSRMYGEHVARRVAEKSGRGIAFIDIDIIVNRELGPIFEKQFDVGLTFRFPRGLELDARGFPSNAQVSPINGGVIFAKPTAEAAGFFAEQMRVYDRLHEEGGIPMLIAQDIRKWGGDQYALLAMLGRRLYDERPEQVEHAGAQVRFFDCDSYNFTPDAGDKLTPELLAQKYIIHMKGPRKQLMPRFAAALGIP